MKRLLLATAVLFARLNAQETGATAVETVQVAQDSQWQNWVFAASLLVTAGVAIFIVSMHSGHEAPDH